jgi:ribosomal protein S27E
MLPLYAAQIEDLGQGDFVKVDCAACHHVALLTPEFLRGLGLSPQAKVLDLKERVRCRGCGARGRAVVSTDLRFPGRSPPPAVRVRVAASRAISAQRPV